MQLVPFPLLLGLVAVAVAADPLAAQGRGRGRAEEIQNRVGVFFSDAAAPAAQGDAAIDLAQSDLVRAAAGAGQLAVLYLYDSRDSQDAREQFERALFGGDELGIMLRCFHCGRIDLAGDPALAARHQKQAPLFVVFDQHGKAGEPVSMSGYKASPRALEAQLVKAAQGAVKPSLAAFAKEYGGFVRDLEQVVNKKRIAKERLAKAGNDQQKAQEADKDLTAIEKEEKQLLAREQDLLGKRRLPERPAGARRLGGRAFGAGDGRGEGRGDGRPGEGRGGESGGGAGRGGNG